MCTVIATPTRDKKYFDFGYKGNERGMTFGGNKIRNTVANMTNKAEFWVESDYVPSKFENMPGM